MDSNQFAQMPPIQPLNGGAPQMQPAMPGGISQIAPVDPSKPKFDVANLIKIIAIVVLSLALITFIGLFIWKNMQYDEVSTDVEGQISRAVAKAKDEQATEDEAEFLEREKYPYRTFRGPVDYGELTFEYPKTWSVYIAKDALKGGDYEAYFNPIEVYPVDKTTINALRVTIRNDAFDTVVAEYQRYMEYRDSDLRVSSIEVGGTSANMYYGTIPNTELRGRIVVFKIRDKTAILQTDAENEEFLNNFETLLKTVQFNA